MNQQEYFGFTDFMDNAATKINSVCSTVKNAINVDNISKEIQGGIDTASQAVQTGINVPIGYLNKGVSFVGDTVTGITDIIGDTVSNTFSAYAGGILDTIDKTVLDATKALKQLDAADPEDQFAGLKYKTGDVSAKLQYVKDANVIYLRSINSLETILNALVGSTQGTTNIASLQAISTYVQNAATASTEANEKAYLNTLVTLLNGVITNLQSSVTSISSNLNGLVTIEQKVVSDLNNVVSRVGQINTQVGDDAQADPSQLDRIMVDLNTAYATVATNGIKPISDSFTSSVQSATIIKNNIASLLNSIVVYQDISKVLAGTVTVTDVTNMNNSPLLTLSSASTINDGMRNKVNDALTGLAVVLVNALKNASSILDNATKVSDSFTSLNTALTSTAVVTESFYFVEPEKTSNPDDQRFPFYHTRREIEGQFPIDIYQFKDIPVIMYSQQTISGKPIQYYKMNNLSYFIHTTMDGLTIEYVQYPIPNKPDFQMYSYSFAGQDQPLVFSNYPVPGVNAQDLSGLQQMGIAPGSNFGINTSAFGMMGMGGFQENFGILDQIQGGVNDYIIDPVKGAFTTAFNTAADFVRGIMGPIKAAANVVASGIKCVYDNVLNIAKQLPKIPGAIKDVAVKAFDGVKDVVVTAVNGVVGTIKNIGTQIYKIGGSVISGVTKTASAVFGAIMSGVKTVVDTVKLIIAGITRLIKFIMALPGKIADFAKSAWNSISGIATGIYTKIKKGILSIFNGDDGEDSVPTIELDQNDPNVAAGIAVKAIRNAIVTKANALRDAILAAVPADKPTERQAVEALLSAATSRQDANVNIDSLSSSIQTVIPPASTDALDALNKLTAYAKALQTNFGSLQTIGSVIPSGKISAAVDYQVSGLAYLASYPSPDNAKSASDLSAALLDIIPADQTAAVNAVNALKNAATTSTPASAENFGFFSSGKVWYKSWWFWLIILILAIAIFVLHRKGHLRGGLNSIKKLFNKVPAPAWF